MILQGKINDQLQEVLRDKEAGKLITRFEIFQRLGKLVFWGLSCAFVALIGLSGIVLAPIMSIIFLVLNLSMSLGVAEKKVKPTQHVDPKDIDA